MEKTVKFLKKKRVLKIKKEKSPYEMKNIKKAKLYLRKKPLQTVDQSHGILEVCTIMISEKLFGSAKDILFTNIWIKRRNPFTRYENSSCGL